MKRNRNIDIIRAVAVLMVVLYHIYAITGLSTDNVILKPFLIYGGIVGVSIFFALSGFGIYNSLKNQEEKKEKFVYHKYLGKRFSRLAPQYYFSLIFLLLFTSNAIYLSIDHLLTIFSHIFFFHNLYYTMAGAISGVCWTLGVTFQFYLIAPYLYKLLEKKPKLTLVSSFVVSISLKYFIFHFILATSGIDNVFLYSNYGNQVFTAIQLFIVGMFAAKKLRETKEKRNNQILNVIGIIISIIGLYAVLRLIDITNISYLENTGIYSDCTMAYIWHNLLAIILGLLIYFAGKLKMNYNSIISKILLFISDYEYGIYIWHLIIIENLKNNAPYIQNLINDSPILTYIILTIISIFMGYIMTELIDKIDYKNLFEPIKKHWKKMLKILLISVSIFCLYKSIGLIKPTIENIKHYVNHNIMEVNISRKIADHADEVIVDKSNCKYAYIDTEETGYLYFYQLRYYLSPCESIHYNKYVHIINYETPEEIYEYLNGLNVNYFIIRDNPILGEELDIEFDSVNGSIFKKNEKSTNIHDLLLEEVK